MKKKIVNIAIIVFLSSILFFSGCTEEKSKNDDQNNNQQNGEDTTDFPIYPDSTEFFIFDESFWINMSIDQSLDRFMYFSNSSIEEVIDWYEDSDNINNWTIKSSGLEGGDLENPTLITFGYAKIQKEDEGLYVFCLLDQENVVDGETVICMAKGPWGLIEQSDKYEEDE